MKRFFLLISILIFSLGASAQLTHFVVQSHNGDLIKCRTADIERVVIPASGDSLLLTTRGGEEKAWYYQDIFDISFEQTTIPIVNYKVRCENDYVFDFLRKTIYDPEDYFYTEVFNYAVANERRDFPNPIVIRLEDYSVGLSEKPTSGNPILLSNSADFSVTTTERLTGDSLVIWNVAPGDTVFYRVLGFDETTTLQQGWAAMQGRERMVYAPSVDNIRDLGGWKTEDGGHLRYGCFFRGSKFQDANRDYITQEDVIRLRDLGIQCELDLRGATEAYGAVYSEKYCRLGKDIPYVLIGHGCYSYLNAVKEYPDYIRYTWNLIRSYVLAHKPIYFNCSRGCDRAGTFALLLEGVLGLCENDLNLDYELSSFCGNAGFRSRNEVTIVPDYDFGGTVNYIKSLEGETLRDKFETFFVDICQISRSDIIALREWMIDYSTPYNPYPHPAPEMEEEDRDYGQE